MRLDQEEMMNTGRNLCTARKSLAVAGSSGAWMTTKKLSSTRIICFGGPIPQRPLIRSPIIEFCRIFGVGLSVLGSRNSNLNVIFRFVYGVPEGSRSYSFIVDLLMRGKRRSSETELIAF